MIREGGMIRKAGFLGGLTVGWLLSCCCSFAADEGPAAWWKFDDGTAAAALDSITGTSDAITGFSKYVDGVAGRALMFDGYTTCVTRSADKAPQLTDAFTIEAWVAMQTLPWNWTAIVDQQGKTHLFFGIDAEGHLGMKLNIDGQLHECVTKDKLGLLKWSHVAATFSQQEGITLYVNGRKAGHLPVKGTLGTEGLTDLFIGKSHEKMSPVGTEREASRKTLSNMVLDGLLDELKIYRRALSPEQVAEAFASVKPKRAKPLKWRRMPCGPKDLPKRFTAYYTRLEYAEVWEKPWRVGAHADILVTFDE
ncbi:MAG: LamG domain-containing protein, partial [Planctomycetota bacterium]